MTANAEPPIQHVIVDRENVTTVDAVLKWWPVMLFVMVQIGTFAWWGFQLAAKVDSIEKYGSEFMREYVRERVALDNKLVANDERQTVLLEDHNRRIDRLEQK